MIKALLFLPLAIWNKEVNSFILYFEGEDDNLAGRIIGCALILLISGVMLWGSLALIVAHGNLVLLGVFLPFIIRGLYSPIKLIRREVTGSGLIEYVNKNAFPPPSEGSLTMISDD